MALYSKMHPKRKKVRGPVSHVASNRGAYRVERYGVGEHHGREYAWLSLAPGAGR